MREVVEELVRGAERLYEEGSHLSSLVLLYNAVKLRLRGSHDPELSEVLRRIEGIYGRVMKGETVDEGEVVAVIEEARRRLGVVGGGGLPVDELLLVVLAPVALLLLFGGFRVAWLAAVGIPLVVFVVLLGVRRLLAVRLARRARVSG